MIMVEAVHFLPYRNLMIFSVIFSSFLDFFKKAKSKIAKYKELFMEARVTELKLLTVT